MRVLSSIHFAGICISWASALFLLQKNGEKKAKTGKNVMARRPLVNNHLQRALKIRLM